jgi:hypothetical protein
MELTHHESSRKELRRFGFTSALIVALLFGVVLPWLLDRAFPLWPWIFASAIVLPALLYPPALEPLYKAWMCFGAIAGFINTRLILGLFYYLIMTPLGLLMRLLRKDPMYRQRDSSQASYRVSRAARPNGHMEKPF